MCLAGITGRPSFGLPFFVHIVTHRDTDESFALLDQFVESSIDFSDVSINSLCHAIRAKISAFKSLPIGLKTRILFLKLFATGRVARIALSLSLTEWPKQRTIRAAMQLKLGIQEAIPLTTNNSVARYSIVALCNKCGGTHDMAVSVILKDGPIEKQSIGDFYDGTNLPKNLADLTSRSISCPKTGRQSIQKDNHQIFLVPTKN